MLMDYIDVCDERQELLYQLQEVRVCDCVVCKLL